MKSKSIDGKLLRSLFKGIENGDENTIEKAVNVANAMAKTTNSRMKRLEDIGYDFYDYDRAYTVLQNWDRKRFKTTWTPKEITENYDMFREFTNATSRFLSAKTKPSEIQARAVGRADWILEKMIGWEKDAFPNDYTNDRIRRYQRMLHPSSDSERRSRREFEKVIAAGPISDLVSRGYGNTDETLDAVIYALENGGKSLQIQNEIELYMDSLQSGGKYYIEDVWDALKNKKWK